MTVAKAKVPPGTPLPQFNTILWIHVTHQGQPHRLGPIQCARTFTYDDLKWRLANRFGLQGERFSVIWFDDDNNEVRPVAARVRHSETIALIDQVSTYTIDRIGGHQ